MQAILITIYLAAIIAANILAATFGPGITILVAFLFIGLDFSTRDFLHELWGGKWLWLKMLALIAAGSILSFLVNANAGPIALASFVAFAASGLVDTLAYTLLHKQSWFIKANGSNLFSSAADSLIFPTIAFGGFLPLIVLGQFTAKVLGGAVWAVVLSYIKSKRPAPFKLEC